MKLASRLGIFLALAAAFFTFNFPTQSAVASAQCGKASWYKMGHTTANGERMDPHAMTAAHRNLPFGTKVRVQNLANGKSVVLRINDRGPYSGGRVIDVTQGAAQKLDFIRRGVTNVRVTVVSGKTALKGC